MSFELPALPYAQDALEPHISAETLEYHYGKHHKTYVDKLNGLVPGTEFEGKSLEEVVKKSSGGMFNNAAQNLNHIIFWNGMSPDKVDMPPAVSEALESAFGSVDSAKEKFIDLGLKQFGSGWVWLEETFLGTLLSLCLLIFFGILLRWPIFFSQMS